MKSKYEFRRMKDENNSALSPDTPGKGRGEGLSPFILHPSSLKLRASFILHPCRASGFAIIEAVIASVIMAIAVAAALQTAGASAGYQIMAARQARASALANDMVSEIMSQPYADASATTSGAGRSSFNDIDDYNGWSASPLQYKDGSAIPNSDGWSRAVKVSLLDSNGSPSATDKGIKEITVTVSKDLRPMVSRVFLRTNHP